MLEKITVGEKDLDSYRPMVMVGDQLLDEVIALGRELRGVRLCYINSTPYGGGVAELLYSCIPLLHSVGVRAEWRIIAADQRFFTVTKGFHNALQGAESWGGAEALCPALQRPGAIKALAIKRGKQR